MNLLAISGSLRQQSTNTALLRGLQAIAPPGIAITLIDGLGELPIFSPDLADEREPGAVQRLKHAIVQSDGLLITCPEYVRTLPGGLKNAIDWLVSGDEIVHKCIALLHASHRGDDMLDTLRTVLCTVSSNFNAELFFRLPVAKETPQAILDLLGTPANRDMAGNYLQAFASFCRSRNTLPGGSA